MSARRTPAPDIAGCMQILYAATLFFAVLQSFYMKSVGKAIGYGLVYGALLALCSAIAWGLFARRSWALGAGILVSALMLLAAVLDFHVPESARVPAGLLGLTGAALLVLSRHEFAPPSGSTK